MKHIVSVLFSLFIPLSIVGLSIPVMGASVQCLQIFSEKQIVEDVRSIGSYKLGRRGKLFSHLPAFEPVRFHLKGGSPNHSFTVTRMPFALNGMDVVKINQRHNLGENRWENSIEIDKQEIDDYLEVVSETLMDNAYSRRQFGAFRGQFLESMKKGFVFSDFVLINDSKMGDFYGSIRMIKAPYITILKDGKNKTLPWPEAVEGRSRFSWSDFEGASHELPVEKFFGIHLDRPKTGYFTETLEIDGIHYPYQIGFLTEISSFAIKQVKDWEDAVQDRRQRVQSQRPGSDFREGWAHPDQRDLRFRHASTEYLLDGLISLFYQPTFSIGLMRTVTSLATQTVYNSANHLAFAYGERRGRAMYDGGGRGLGFGTHPTIRRFVEDPDSDKPVEWFLFQSDNLFLGRYARLFGLEENAGHAYGEIIGVLGLDEFSGQPHALLAADPGIAIRAAAELIPDLEDNYTYKYEAPSFGPHQQRLSHLKAWWYGRSSLLGGPLEDFPAETLIPNPFRTFLEDLEARTVEQVQRERP